MHYQSAFKFGDELCNNKKEIINSFQLMFHSDKVVSGIQIALKRINRTVTFISSHDREIDNGFTHSKNGLFSGSSDSK